VDFPYVLGVLGAMMRTCRVRQRAFPHDFPHNP